MKKEVEIEKKYRLKKIIPNLEQYEHKTIEQSYINKGGTPIRLRKFVKGNKITYILSKKERKQNNSIEYIEHNIELTEGIYKELLQIKEGRTILKTRYKIPLSDGLKIDLDIFDGFFKGVCVAEIEYNSVEQANNYCIPDWLEEIKSWEKLTNIYMATEAKDINEYKEFIVK